MILEFNCYDYNEIRDILKTSVFKSAKVAKSLRDIYYSIKIKKGCSLFFF